MVDPVEELVGRGVHYGAAVSAAPEMEGRDVFVVGGGNSAGQAALHLARYARSVTLLVRRPDVSATMSDYLIREMRYMPQIRIRECAEVVDGGGQGRLEWIGIRGRRRPGRLDEAGGGGVGRGRERRTPRPRTSGRQFDVDLTAWEKPAAIPAHRA